MGAWIEIKKHPYLTVGGLVAPLVGAWIEICKPFGLIPIDLVAPLVGAWIEIIRIVYLLVSDIPSLPLWERGLKLLWKL